MALIVPITGVLPGHAAQLHTGHDGAPQLCPSQTVYDGRGDAGELFGLLLLLLRSGCDGTRVNGMGMGHIGMRTTPAAPSMVLMIMPPAAAAAAALILLLLPLMRTPSSATAPFSMWGGGRYVLGLQVRPCSSLRRMKFYRCSIDSTASGSRRFQHPKFTGGSRSRGCDRSGAVRKRIVCRSRVGIHSRSRRRRNSHHLGCNVAHLPQIVISNLIAINVAVVSSANKAS